MSDRFEDKLQRAKREVAVSTEKYVYYVIALAVAAIGFSVVRTSGSHLTVIQAPLGGAVLSWAISIYCGLRLLRKDVVYQLKETMRDESMKATEVVSENPLYVRVSEINTELRDLARTIGYLIRWQLRLFYFGVVLFLTWHILEMYQVQPST